MTHTNPVSNQLFNLTDPRCKSVVLLKAKTLMSLFFTVIKDKWAHSQPWPIVLPICKRSAKIQ